jgi:hypothetical protein
VLKGSIGDTQESNVVVTISKTRCAGRGKRAKHDNQLYSGLHLIL